MKARLGKPLRALYLSLNWHIVSCHLGPQGGVEVPCLGPTFGTLEFGRSPRTFPRIITCPMSEIQEQALTSRAPLAFPSLPVPFSWAYA